eukprot:scaffold2580_cov388-Prasinococcus_capsulatus_cf.AAC.29
MPVVVMFPPPDPPVLTSRSVWPGDNPLPRSGGQQLAERHARDGGAAAPAVAFEGEGGGERWHGAHHSARASGGLGSVGGRYRRRVSQPSVRLRRVTLPRSARPSAAL